MTNHQQTATNDKIDFSRQIPVIYFFRKLETESSSANVNKHRHLTYLDYLTFTIHLYIFSADTGEERTNFICLNLVRYGNYAYQLLFIDNCLF